MDQVPTKGYFYINKKQIRQGNLQCEHLFSTMISMQSFKIKQRLEEELKLRFGAQDVVGHHARSAKPQFWLESAYRAQQSQVAERDHLKGSGTSFKRSPVSETRGLRHSTRRHDRIARLQEWAELGAHLLPQGSWATLRARDGEPAHTMLYTWMSLWAKHDRTRYIGASYAGKGPYAPALARLGVPRDRLWVVEEVGEDSIRHGLDMLESQAFSCVLLESRDVLPMHHALFSRQLMRLCKRNHANALIVESPESKNSASALNAPIRMRLNYTSPGSRSRQGEWSLCVDKHPHGLQGSYALPRELLTGIQ